MQSVQPSSDDLVASFADPLPYQEINDLIDEKLVTNFGQNKFLADESCQSIVHDRVFEQWFSEQPDLSKWIQEHATKFFLIVTNIHRIGKSASNQRSVMDKMQQIYANRIDDSLLPLTFGCQLKCMKGKIHFDCDNSLHPVHQIFRTWDYYEGIEFLNLQKKFTAPVFRKEKFIYELDPEIILPIRALNGRNVVDNRGCFGEVERLEMKQEHQDSFTEVRNPTSAIFFAH